MKLNFTVDCTPEEARKFFGLPDLQPMQDAVMAKIQQQVLDVVTVSSPEAMLRTWFPLAPQTPEQFQEAMTRFFRSTFGPSTPRNGG